MARVVERGLRRTVGVPGLFATAYGNVGSSIYYALGLVAAYALGLTPLVFIFAGGLFALTAKTYAEGASMFPEAGGSSSFARHAFNEIASFFAGWALTLDYIITIAISAFFVPHYLGAFFPGLRHNPGGIFAGISIISLSALPVTQDAAGHYHTLLGTKYENDPVLGIVSALPLGHGLQTALTYYVGVLAATILVIATNAGLIGISRLSWSLAEHRQLPGVFAKVHPKYRTPYFTIAFFSVLAALLLIPGKTDFLGNLYSFGAMLSFTTAHVAIVALRFKDPDRKRPCRVPWNVPFRGRSLPLAAVLGAIGTFAAWCSVVVLHVEARTVGIGWMVAGMTLYFLYRRSQGLDPTTQYVMERKAAPQGFRELAYGSRWGPSSATT